MSRVRGSQGAQACRAALSSARSLLAPLQTWAAHHAFSQRARAVLVHFSQQAMAKAFASWRHAVARQALLASRLDAVLRRWSNSKLAAAFAGEMGSTLRAGLGCSALLPALHHGAASPGPPPP